MPAGKPSSTNCSRWLLKAVALIPLPLRRWLRLKAADRKETLRRFAAIQKKVTLFLLVVFALSATPKAFFHDLLAKHTDGLVCTNQDRSKPCLHREAYHCSFDDLVVTAPYLSVTPDVAVHHQFFPPQHNAFFQSPVLPAFIRYTNTRGPPLMD